MARAVLLVGRIAGNLDEVRRSLDASDFQIFGATGIEELRAIFAKAQIDHVIMGGGIDLDIRPKLVEEILRLSDATTIHMKDHASGFEAFLPFVQSVVAAVREYDARLVQ
ncbi:MAG TPA: hypothetical protein VGI19_19425 [Candidatus Cybelea sp.]